MSEIIIPWLTSLVFVAIVTRLLFSDVRKVKRLEKQCNDLLTELVARDAKELKPEDE